MHVLASPLVLLEAILFTFMQSERVHGTSLSHQLPVHLLTFTCSSFDTQACSGVYSLQKVYDMNMIEQEWIDINASAHKHPWLATLISLAFLTVIVVLILSCMP
jgi:hypothetical protein